MRTLSYVTAKQIADAIENNSKNMEARLVARNKFNQEYLVKLVSIYICVCVCVGVFNESVE